MSREYQPSIDWLKAIGLTLIVLGHFADAAMLTLLPPIYPKQIGVALFLYAAGYGLAREQRSTWQVLSRRLFDVYLYGLAAALLISVIGLATFGDALESNYLPFIAGVNVVLDDFPANPTTWYIGAYVHILLVWGLVLRRFDLRYRTVAMILVGEVIVRAALIQSAGAFVAYMNVSNWITVFALGLVEGRARALPAHGTGHVVDRGARLSPWTAAAFLVAFVVAWTMTLARIPVRTGFPFMTIALVPQASAFATSVAVSTLYLVCTILTVRAVRSVPAPAVVRFVARNTLIVFIAHMPVYYAVQPVVRAAASGYWTRVLLYLIVGYVALLIVSEVVQRLTNRLRLRERVLSAITPSPSPVAGSSGRSSFELT
ncbi:MAG TPA: acyltransferase [Vicinamibacterales bacterium]|jgi:peptidoglycan/LPS O-acetylase OafA/YrhL|nr:acyltransferase [Vicinamibacterales bacterium]